MRNTKVKICGIRFMEDIEVLNEYKPDFAGFVLAPSKRRIEISQLKYLVSGLNQEIIPVGVFVNPESSLISEAIVAGIKILQLHGDESPQDIEDVKNLLVRENQTRIQIWKAIRIRKEEETDPLNSQAKNSSYQDFSGLVNGILYDKYDSHAYGGTGKVFDWNLIKGCSGRDRVTPPLILAGGLTVDNVESAISTVLPYCVDVSSGVETNGLKDRHKIKAFIEKVD